MPNNAKRRRALKEARRLHGGIMRSRQPTAYLPLLDYVAREWRVSTRQAREWLQGGKINVNGSVWAYPEVPKHLVERDEFGRYRIMVEGQPDPRPAEGGVILKRKAS